MKRILPFLIALFYSASLLAQDRPAPATKPKPPTDTKDSVVMDNDYVVFDYLQMPDKTVTRKMKYKEKVGIKVINVNKKLVDFTKNSTGTDYNTTQPAIFNAFTDAKLPEAGSTGFGTMKAIKLNKNDFPGITDPAVREQAIDFENQFEKITADINKQHDELKIFVDQNTYFRKVSIYQSDITDLQNNCNTSFDDLNKAFIALTKSKFQEDGMGYKEITKRNVFDFTDDKRKNRMYIREFLDELYDQSKTSYITVSVLFSDDNVKLINTAISNLSKSGSSLLSTLKKAKHPSQAESNLIKSLTDHADTDMLTANENEIAATYKAVDPATISKNMDTFAASGFKDFFTIYDFFTEVNFIYYVPAKVVTNDAVTVSVDITPKDNLTCNPIARSYEVDIRTKGGLKLDFSSGFFGNFGGHDFFNQSYRKDSIAGNTSSYVIRKNTNKNIIMPSVGALMHIYFRNGTDFQPAFCFGLSTNDLSKVNYHFGGSLIFGTSQRFIINGGITIAKATLLSDQYTVDEVIPKTTFPSTIPTDTYTRFGYFIGVTYNLSSK
jgi:hypothetical protein